MARTYNFGHVKNDDGRFETNTKTSNETTGNKETETAGGNLQDDTNDVNDTTNDDSVTTTNDFSQVTCNKRTKELSKNVRSSLLYVDSDILHTVPADKIETMRD